MASNRLETLRAIQEPTTKSGNAPLVGGILAGIGASICCGIPLVLVTLGISGAWISTLTAFAPLRPVFIVLAVVLFGFAVRRAFFPPKVCVASAACANPKAQRNQRTMFVVLSILFVAIFAFPWYGPLFL